MQVAACQIPEILTRPANFEGNRRRKFIRIKLGADNSDKESEVDAVEVQWEIWEHICVISLVLADVCVVEESGGGRVEFELPWVRQLWDEAVWSGGFAWAGGLRKK